MAAHTREFPDVDWYTCRIAGISTALKNMDAKTVKAPNGTAGSSHAPAAPIIIGGSGTVCAGPWVHGGTGLTAAGAHIQHGAGHVNDYVRLRSGHPGSTRSLTSSVLPTIPDGYLHAYATSENNFTSTMRYPGGRELISLALHDRSTLFEVRIRFRVRTSHATLPTVPKFRVIRVDSSGKVVALHTSRSGSYRDDGFLDLPTNSTTVALYQAGGLHQWSQAYQPDQNNVIDVSKYAYFIDFIEESGASAFTPNVSLSPGAGTQLFRIEMVCNAIANLAPQ